MRADTDWRTEASDLFPLVSERLDALVADLADHVRQPAVSATGTGIDVAAARLADTMRAAGLRAEVLATEGHPVVYGELLVDAAKPTLLVYGHYDVQPAEPLDAWTTPPFDPVVRDGRLYGRGTADNKGQHLAQLAAIRIALDGNGELPVNVKMIVEGEEEIASPHLASFVTRHRDRLSADLAYTSDGAVHPSGAPLVVCGARGLAYLEICVHGAETDRHSGNFGGLVSNPARQLAEVIGSFWDTAGRVAVDGFSDGVRQPTDEEWQAVARLGDVERYERLLLAPNLEIAGLRSGWTGPGMKTIVPSTATAKVEARLVPDQDPEQVLACLRAHVTARLPGAEVVPVGSVPPSRTPVDHPVVTAVAAAVAHGWGELPLVFPSLPGTVPDHVFTRLLGLPSVLVPYGNADQANHAPDENLRLDHFQRGIQVFLAVLYAVAAADLPTRSKENR